MCQQVTPSLALCILNNHDACVLHVVYTRIKHKIQPALSAGSTPQGYMLTELESVNLCVRHCVVLNIIRGATLVFKDYTNHCTSARFAFPIFIRCIPDVCTVTTRWFARAHKSRNHLQLLLESEFALALGTCSLTSMT
jgi:hypothetical protein